MQQANLTIYDKPEDAPNFERPEYIGCRLAGFNVVGNGTTDGGVTVDIILEDDDGQKSVVMVTANMLSMVVGAAAGLKQRLDEVRLKTH